ncbi:MAG TPA: polysaccharide pyruvyl transferase CsaB [Paenibacillus sp.]|uniref:polysaccharide pyruvyl transferase CsaB n=1 Tax=Paenibacillus sp. TaxID=58172 RepID=UPI002CD22BF0|nr:polysaccharide pyruvyl transferase CsaB [Paenibacillus sp.]HUC92566.1 polysaccharide pyruvyl transferase CsaB [Paenibacillus sp.]
MGGPVYGQTFRLVVSGYYGFRNSGDEAVLKSILFALELEAERQGVRIEPVVLSIDPAWTAAMYGVESAHRMRPMDVLRAIRGSDGLISGGGSLLQDATSAKTIPYYTGILRLAQLLGKPTFIYSQGIGPVNRRWMNPLIRGVMKRSRYVSVRDAESAALLARMGVDRGRIEVVPDPVMGLPLPEGAEASAVAGGAPAAEPGGDRVPVVGVSLRGWRKDASDLARAASALAALARRRPVRLRFLPFHMPEDAAVSHAVMARLGAIGASTAEVAAPGDDPQQMLLEVSRCDLVFAMRLHALIYAANRQVPMLGLSYDPKIDRFLGRLGLTAIGTTESLDDEAFADAAEALLDEAGAEAWRSRHRDAILKLKDEAERPAKQIVQYLRQKIVRSR